MSRSGGEVRAGWLGTWLLCLGRAPLERWGTSSPKRKGGAVFWVTRGHEAPASSSPFALEEDNSIGNLGITSWRMCSSKSHPHGGHLLHSTVTDIPVVLLQVPFDDWNPSMWFHQLCTTASPSATPIPNSP